MEIENQREKDEIVKVFALQNRWLPGWLDQQREAMISLYDRDFTMEAVAMHCVKSSSYSMQTKDYIDTDFIKAFFSPFPKIEVLTKPDATAYILNAPVISPRIFEESRLEEPWKYHIQQLVLIESDRYNVAQNRLEYLYKFVPQQVVKNYNAFKEADRKKVLERMMKP